MTENELDFLAAPKLISCSSSSLSLHKQIFDLNTNALGQWAVSEILRRGLMVEHLTMLRQRYQHKRDLMLQAISTHWPRDVRVSHPQGGFHIWCRLLGDMRARSVRGGGSRQRRYTRFRGTHSPARETRP